MTVLERYADTISATHAQRVFLKRVGTYPVHLLKMNRAAVLLSRAITVADIDHIVAHVFAHHIPRPTGKTQSFPLSDGMEPVPFMAAYLASCLNLHNRAGTLAEMTAYEIIVIDLSKEAYAFIAGIIKHVKGIAAFSNPLVNSYKRLVPGYEAPCYIAWSASNRSSLVRIPAARGKGTRVELRNPDPTCNPYLEMALCLAAGLDGIKKNMTPPAPVDFNVFDLTAEELKENGIDCLPGSLIDAVYAAEEDPFVKETVGSHVFNAYIEGKKREWDEYRTQISQWEVDRYLKK